MGFPESQEKEICSIPLFLVDECFLLVFDFIKGCEDCPSCKREDAGGE